MSVPTISPSALRIGPDQVIFDGFVETDRHVIEALMSCPDPDACAHELLHLGARLAGLAAGTTGLSELEARVGARLEALAGDTAQSVAGGLETLGAQFKAFFADDDGEVTRALASWREDLDRHLGEAFDPDRKASLVASWEQSMLSMLDSFGRKVLAASNPDDPTSLAGRLMAEVRAGTLRQAPARPMDPGSTPFYGSGTFTISRREPSKVAYLRNWP